MVVVAGERYGAGSSRDWAAKGLALLGVSAVLAPSFERIHRSNLIGMGILPLRLPPEQHPRNLRLLPGDLIAVEADAGELCTAHSGARRDSTRPPAGSKLVNATAAVETALEVEILRVGGIIPFILRRAMTAAASSREGAQEFEVTGNGGHARRPAPPNPGR